MTIETINNGASAGDQSAETVYSAFGKVNENFTSVGAELAVLSASVAQMESDVTAIEATASSLSSSVSTLSSSVSTAEGDIDGIQTAHGSSGTGQYQHTLHKTGVNTLDTAARSCVIAGGGDLGSSTRSTEPGAYGRNEIGAHASYVAGTAHYATISGGYDNRNDQLAGTICGGGHILLSYQGSHCTVCGGSHHAVLGDSDYCTIGGGTQNVIGATSGGDANTIGGGYSNDITRGPDNTIGGGRDNAISSSNAAGGNTIAGGSGNTISGSGGYGAIIGGQGNTLNASGNGGAILGGSGNIMSGSYSAIVGQNNTVGSSAVGSLTVGASSSQTDPYQLVVGLDHSPPSGLDGAIVFGGNCGAFSADGTAEGFVFTMSAQTTDAATAVHMAVRGSTAPTIPLNSAWVGTALVIGKRVGQISVAAYRFDFCVSRHTSGNIVVEYEPAGAAKYLNGAGGPDEPGIGTTNVPRIRTGVSTFQLSVNGAAGVTINWLAVIKIAAVIA